ncbi:MAG: hypothetical protein ACI9OJ_004397 [Myxococcota bacterium]|jgi:hypothetical protein
MLPTRPTPRLLSTRRPADHALVVGHSPDGLVLAATDGSNASEPLALDGPTDLVPHSVSPSGTRMILSADDGVYIAGFTEGSAERVIETDNAHANMRTWWTDGGSVVISAPSAAVSGSSWLTGFDPQSGTSTPIGNGLTIVATHGLNVDQSALVVEMQGADDRSIWAIPLDGSPPVALTALDDLAYEVVEFVGP